MDLSDPAMPHDMAGTREVMGFITDQLSTNTAVNIMPPHIALAEMHGPSRD